MPKNIFTAFSLTFPSGKNRIFHRPAIMGVINLSPDSFYHPIHNVNDALKEAEKMIEEGADFLDIGGEATNLSIDLEKDLPSTKLEMQRIVPVIEAIKKKFSIPVSVDTSKPEVMQAAIDAGVDMINDQRALRIGNAAEIAIRSKMLVCLMYWFFPVRKPGSSTPEILLKNICEDLALRVKKLMEQGLSKNKIILDPGFGQGNYGKNVAENFYIVEHLSELTELGFPVLAGWSRKSMIGDVLGVSPEQRLYGSIAAALLAVQNGASILRVHDVKPTIDALKIWFSGIL